MERMFADHISSSISSDHSVITNGQIDVEELDAASGGDVHVQNIIGDKTVVEVAERWAESGTFRKKLEGIRGWLDEELRVAVDRVLGYGVHAEVAKPSQNHRIRYGESEEETDDDDDQKGKMAHLLFAEHATDEMSGESSSDRSGSTRSRRVKMKAGVMALVSSPLQSKVEGKRKLIDEAAQVLSPHSVESTSKSDQLDSALTPPNAGRHEPLFDVRNNHAVVKSSVRGTSEKTVMQEVKKRLATPHPAGENVKDKRPKLYLVHGPSQQSSRGSPHSPHSPRSLRNTLQISPRAAAGREFRAQRLKIGERLSRARPDLVLSTYAATRERLLSRRRS